MFLRSAQNFDYFNELVDARLARKDGLAKHQLRNHTAHGPNVDVGAVVCVAENELRSAVVPRANVAYIGLALDELFGGTEVAKLEDVALGVDEDVLRLDVSVANALGVNVGDRAQQLVAVQLDEQVRHHLFHF